MSYHFNLSLRCCDCGREVVKWVQVFCAADYSQKTGSRLDPDNRCYIGRGALQYPREEVQVPGMQYKYLLWSDDKCEVCQKQGREMRKGGQAMTPRNRTGTVISNHGNASDPRVSSKDRPGVKGKADAKAKTARRALSKEEKRQRKLEIEALFNNPKALEEQQRLLQEAVTRMQKRP